MKTFDGQTNKDLSVEEITKLIDEARSTSKKAVLFFFDETGFGVGETEFSYRPAQNDWVRNDVGMNFSTSDDKILDEIIDVSAIFGDPQKTLITLLA